MRENRVKRVMEEGGLAIGTFVSLADPQVVEIIGVAGFDAAFIDMEHTGFDVPLVGEMIRAAEVAGITSMVRVPDEDAKLMTRLLEMGAEGIVVPHVDGLEGAKRAVDAVRFPPVGQGGTSSGTRATRFGAVPWTEYKAWANDQIVLSVMVEDQKAIDEVEAIACLDGIDLVAIGPNDLAQTLGVRDATDPRLRSKVEEIAQRVRSVGKAKLAIPTNNAMLPITPEGLVELGVGYSHVGPPPTAVLLQSMQDRVKSIHKATRRAS